MKIKSISIRNFRSYYGTHSIELYEGLNIFIGDNGDGKSTLFDSLNWLFDTTLTEQKNERLISKKCIAQLVSGGDTEKVSVSMTFEHDGEKHIEKSFDFFLDVNSNLKTANYQFIGYEESGSERQRVDGRRLLDRCFDASIRQYCLFKGEERLDIFNTDNALQYLVNTFSEVHDFDMFYTGDEEGFTEFAVQNAKRAKDVAIKNANASTQKERDLNAAIGEISRQLSSVDRDFKDAENNYNKYDKLLTDIESHAEASEDLRRINDRIKNLKERKENTELKIDDAYSKKLLDDYWIMCGMSSVIELFSEKTNAFIKEKQKLEIKEAKKKGKKEAIKEIAAGVLPLDPLIPDKKSMENMIHDEFCKVCGRPAPKGSDPYNFMVQKLQSLLDSISGDVPEDEEETKMFVNNYSAELQQIQRNVDYMTMQINGLQNEISNSVKENNRLKMLANNLQRSIDDAMDEKNKLLSKNNNITEEELDTDYKNISNWNKFRNDAGHNREKLKIRKKELNDKLTELQSELAGISKDDKSKTAVLVHQAMQYICSAFAYAKQKNTRDFIELLTAHANGYLKKLNVDDFHGVIQIIERANGAARLQLVDNDGTIVTNPNTALETSKFMSVLFAISDLTTLKRENDYPLIFDAPTSSFGPQKERDFYAAISSVNKQCIIATKSFLKEDGSLDMPKIEHQKGKIFRLSLNPDCDLEKMSTIQTNIEPIKMNI